MIKLLQRVLESENSIAVTRLTADNQRTDRVLLEVEASEDEAILEAILEVEVDNTRGKQGSRESLEATKFSITNLMVPVVLVIPLINHANQHMILFNKIVSQQNRLHNSLVIQFTSKI